MLPPLSAKGVPHNDTDGFFNELFEYSGGANDFDSMDLAEVAAGNPEVVARMHATLLAMVL